LIKNQFVVDDVSKIIKEAIETTIGGNAYQHDKVNNWTGAVVETCLGVLTKLQKPYKYIGKLYTFHYFIFAISIIIYSLTVYTISIGNCLFIINIEFLIIVCLVGIMERKFSFNLIFVLIIFLNSLLNIKKFE